MTQLPKVPLGPQSTGVARQFAVAALAVLLMAGGIALALQSMALERGIRARYSDALQVAQLALEAEQYGADLRVRQARLTRVLAGQSLLSTAPVDIEAMTTALNELRDRKSRMMQLDIAFDQAGDLAALDAVLADLERLNSRLLDSREQGPLTPRQLTALMDESQRLYPQLDAGLRALVTAARDRTVAAGNRAEEFNQLARFGLIAFSVATLMLGVLLLVLTTRAIGANRALLRQLEHVAREDPLTGAINRRGLDDGLALEFARALRGGRALSLVMLDLDYFKRFNDRRGHAAGDALLRAAAQNWIKQLRPTDLLARYGGEEFTIVLPDCSLEQASALVERLRPQLPEHQTFSAGIACWDGIESAAELIRRADQALLQAKKAGRNRTLVAGREPQATLPLKVA